VADDTETILAALRHPYVARVALVLTLASVTVTLGDFIFKSVVAESVAPNQLSSFFAVAYFAFDVVALALLLLAVPSFVRVRGVAEALAVQPALLIVGGALLTAFGGLVPVLFLRGIDGALRWSLHKTVTELLYVPLGTQLRATAKTIADVAAHRGGQALASLGSTRPAG
jgi:AAA family ATP:ADP antiporter